MMEEIECEFGDDVFIDHVREYPELYNKRDTGYMCLAKKDGIWEELSSRFGFDAKKKWYRLRDRYVRVKRSLEERPESDANEAPYWPLYESLKFLDENLRPRRAREKSRMNNWSAKASNASSKLLTSTSHASIKKQAGKNALESMFIETLSKLKDTVDKVGNADDEDLLFMKSIACQMKRMVPSEKLKFKIEILQSAHEAVEASSILSPTYQNFVYAEKITDLTSDLKTGNE